MEAFSALMDRYQRPVFHGVLQRVRNYEDAKEVSQQAFLKAFEHLNTFDPARRFFSWIYRIAMNEAISFLKARHFHDTIGEDGLDPSDGAPSETDTLDDQRRHRDLRRAIARLDPKYGSVVTLFHLLQMSYEEVAEALGIPEKTVKSRLFSARQRLREEMEGLGHAH
jgi:RNA polymerase sigma-70 factor (ECF subfamily)